jgi:peptidoglycan hydrolase-like protein with peptidoglycan-binding domain
MIRSAAFLLIVVVLAVAAGCGGDDEAETTVATTTVTTTTTTTGTTTTTTTGTTTTTSEPIAAGLWVAKLQTVMTSLGYYSGPIDGSYGEDTTAAVQAMQEDLGVEPADGIYGPETHAALQDKATSVVVEIQTTLTEYGYYSGDIDGVYGENTVAAVQELQTDLGVTADGRVGPETVDAFNEAVANGDLEPVE